MNERWREVAGATGLLNQAGNAQPTIFAEMSALAMRTDSANLGQGFPDEDGPEWIRELAVDAIRAGVNQYAPGRGTAELRHAIAAHQAKHYGITLDPDREVLVTTGATEAIAAALIALTGPGDEVVTLEPFYDSHAASIAMAGATHVTVPLLARDGRFQLDLQALESAISDRTKAILVNTPHNPTGTVLTEAELDAIAAAAQRADAIVITDEVYEHLVFDEARHQPLASRPGMAERTLTISSSGKTFSITGWKIGWLTGPAELVDAVLAVKQFLTFTSGAPFQGAIAQALIDGDTDIRELRETLARRREVLIAGLSSAGFETFRPDGTYFVCADATPFLSSELPDGAAFARWLPENIGVACVPLSAFCAEGSPAAAEFANWVRFTFVKRDDTLHTAIERLQKLRAN
ncbi:aminotransferase class I/II-fold pyridoxal phosphate-dependent enzyme [Leucobacter sp. UT-8R-CII-1-4]|uniref:aminotransferase class I/II-fold pyridoxal phosphate-dependent enzyme n=1 Tax=Leucobacter sp. UT-8R-CII-1-4 TaxID=3040075 RepID=UPI0024A849CE|nr:aminotransferase class I/II-fold pyridoxal phosphate-dependent enzyme [Leucobacter sp. UT-8R-CII-1-4]MDI6023687.1 aminotransferase class I/II-fold pyridoxal phosphate-dependent enzyme [Leucobacter sp. UT-8R-CII-1-4]